MSIDDVDRSDLTIPKDFLCEHSRSKSRVLALIDIDGLPTARAVMTLDNRVLAERAAQLLRICASGGDGVHVGREISRLAESLPSAPAAAFREAVEMARAGAWPIDRDLVPSRDAVAEAYDTVLDEYGEETLPTARDRILRTPDDARLAALSGAVVRIYSLSEFHVYDPERLFAAARERGWTPDDGDEQEDLVLDAALSLANIDEPAGTDWVTETSIGEVLDPRRGDEVADYSETPVAVDFSRGWW